MRENNPTYKKNKKYFYFYGTLIIFALYYLLTLLRKEGFINININKI
jgi:hypothetical protein